MRSRWAHYRNPAKNTCACQRGYSKIHLRRAPYLVAQLDPNYAWRTASDSCKYELSIWIFLLIWEFPFIAESFLINSRIRLCSFPSIRLWVPLKMLLTGARNKTSYANNVCKSGFCLKCSCREIAALLLAPSRNATSSCVNCARFR